jgi:hypothetical protein
MLRLSFERFRTGSATESPALVVAAAPVFADLGSPDAGPGRPRTPHKNAPLSLGRSVWPSDDRLADGQFRPPAAPGHGVRFDGLEQYRLE